jgi:7-cyano-7-deazaguanine synthase
MERAERLLKLSTLSGVSVASYTLDLDKAGIVALGLEREAPLELVYSCYRDSPEGRMCGTCRSCLRLKAALEAAGALDRLAGRFEE